MYAQLYNPKTVEKKYSTINITDNQRKTANEWIKKLKNKELEKEKKNYFVFRDVVLRDLLGYPEEKILYEEKNVEFSIQDEHGDTGVCFEAKGTKTKDLFARQGYEKKEQENPVVQTLSNMERFPASYGVCTNYRDFVLLDRKKRLSKCHRFDFLSIENSDKKLKEFIGIFSYKNLVIEKTLDELYNSSVSEEREFTKEFYKLFHETRLMLIKAFQEKEKVTMYEAIHYAQLYLNRLIFIFFAEDKGDIDERLFSKRVLKILEAGQGTESSCSVSDDILKLFKYLDKGSDVQGIFGFNGGLFKERIPSKIYFFDLKNPEFFAEVKQHSKLSRKIVLDELSSKIVKKYKDRLNPIISNLLIMDSFDFNTEVNVNILGHIFEQSISDLEDLREEGVSRRRKEGVFYTPEYITEYICTKTIIPYLSNNNASTVTELIGEYLENPEQLESRIREIKILDPACGSGAFLVKAVEILFEIDKELQSIKPQTNGQSHLEDWSDEKEITKIIEKNVFGVDINYESVEITKLSLLLKMAAPNKKLSDLSKNIMHGNSLVNDKKIDSKAFCWEKEFPEIFEQGGFDIIIGNPPYIRIQTLDKNQVDYFNTFYETPTKNYDIYILFIEKGFKLLKEKGFLGFILPHKFFQGESGEKIRKFIYQNKALNMIVNFGTNQVFYDASTYTCILSLQKKVNQKFYYKGFKLGEDFMNLSLVNFEKRDIEILQDDKWNFSSTDIRNVLATIKSQEQDFVSITKKIFKGSSTGNDDIFLLDLVKKGKSISIAFSSGLNQEVEIENALLHPFVYGEDIRRYVSVKSSKMLLFPYTAHGNNVELIPIDFFKKNYPKAFNYLNKMKNELLKRKSVKLDSNNFYKYSAARSLPEYTQPKIMIPDMLVSNRVSYDYEGIFYHGPAIHSVVFNDKVKDHSPFFYLGILNSPLFWFFIVNTSTALRGDAYRLTPEFVNPFCFPTVDANNKGLHNEIVSKVELMLQLNKDHIAKETMFWNRVNHTFSNTKITEKLENFFTLTFNEFLNQIQKISSVRLSLKDQDEWEDYFKSYKKDLIELKTQSDKLDNEINQLVYKIYSLSDDEILIVDENYPKSV